MGKCYSKCKRCLRGNEDDDEDGDQSELGQTVRNHQSKEYSPYNQNQKRSYLNESFNSFKKFNSKKQYPKSIKYKSKPEKYDDLGMHHKKSNFNSLKSFNDFGLASSRRQLNHKTKKQKFSYQQNKNKKQNQQKFPLNNLFRDGNKKGNSKQADKWKIKKTQQIIIVQPQEMSPSEEQIDKEEEGMKSQTEIIQDQIDESQIAINLKDAQQSKEKDVPLEQESKEEPEVQIVLNLIVHSQSQKPQQQEASEEEQSQQYEDADPSQYDNMEKKVVEPLLSKLRKIQEASTQLIENSQYFPYNRIGCLQMEITKGKKHNKFVGSGVVVGPRYVLTACHNLYSYLMQQQYELKQFRLNYNHFNQQPQFAKSFKIKSKFGNIEQYKHGIENGDFSLDYAFLELDTDEDLEEFNNFRFDFGDKEENSEDLIISYPYNKEKRIVEFSESKGRTIVQDNHIYHQFKVRQGSSGGPIFKCEEGDYFIIGLHSGKGRHQTLQPQKKQFFCRVGPKFTERIFFEFVQFMAEIDGCVDLKNKQIGNEGCRVLVKALGEELTHLNLTNNKVGLKACESLAKCQWGNLRVLNLSNNLLNPQCFVLMRHIALPSITELILQQNQLSAECCQQLTTIPFPTLQLLNLGYNNFGDKGCEYLSQSNWPKLKKLYLFWNNIEDQGCLHLSQANWPQLTFIDLHENGIGAMGCEHLSRTNWSLLTEINLDKNIIGDEGCKNLVKASWANLQKVHLWRNSITMDGAGYLLKGGWKDLTFINLNQNSIDKPQEIREQFQRKYTKLDILLE